MDKYLKQHEEFMKQAILLNDEGYNWRALKEYHQMRIGYMQHERLIHLLVTLAFAIMLFIALSIAYNHTTIEMLIIIALILVLLVPYVFHYFMLENGVQRWYRLMDEIDRKIK